MQPHPRLLLLLVTGTGLVFAIAFLSVFWNEATKPLQALLGARAFSHGLDSTNMFPKYFQEAQERGVLHHYDSRFQHGMLMDANRTDAQTHMMRAYLEFSKEHGLETWLAHGTLLGWWWNAKVMSSLLPLQFLTPQSN